MKRKFGQAALHAIDMQLLFSRVEDKQGRAELRAYRAAFKKMAGMSKSELGYLALLFFGVSQSWTTPLLVKDILKARAVEKR